MTVANKYKSIITVLFLTGIIGLSYIGLKKLPDSNSNVSLASDKELEPIGLRVSNVTDKSANVSWTTKEKSVSILFYSNDKTCLEEELNTSKCPFLSENSSSTEHKLALSELKSNTTYYYKIKTENYVYPKDSSFSFSTHTKQGENSADSNNPDSEGIVEEKEPIDSDGKILGKEKAENAITIDFKSALEDQDLNFDFNNDAVVDIKDYPLYVEFVSNKED